MALDIPSVMKLMKPLKRMVEAMVARSIINSIKYMDGVQVVQLSVLADETMDDIEHMQEFGFASGPPAGSSALVLSVAGERGHMVVVATDNAEHRPEVEPGESMLYNEFGVTLKLNKDGELELDAPVKVIVTAPIISLIGDLDVTGNITATGNITDLVRSMAADRTIYNTHLHPGVTSGPSSTGATTQTQ